MEISHVLTQTVTKVVRFKFAVSGKGLKKNILSLRRCLPFMPRCFQSYLVHICCMREKVKSSSIFGFYRFSFSICLRHGFLYFLLVICLEMIFCRKYIFFCIYMYSFFQVPNLNKENVFFCSLHI